MIGCPLRAMLVYIYVPTCIHLFPHARADTIPVVGHEHNFSKFYQLTISFLVPQFCTLESRKQFMCIFQRLLTNISIWQFSHKSFKSQNLHTELTRKISAMICLHDSSKIIARTRNFFSCHLSVVKRQRFFNASYSFHVYLIELMFDVDYRSIVIIKKQS